MILAECVHLIVIERDGSETPINNPGDFPDAPEFMRRKIQSVQEPLIRATIITPDEYTGPLMELCAVSQQKWH